MRIMERVCPKLKYDSWRETEQMLRRTRDKGMKVTLPQVSIQEEFMLEGDWDCAEFEGKS